MLIPADAVAQRRYVRDARATHPTPSLGIGPTILRGLRDLGYRDSAAALCALVDNAIDAQASEIDIVFDSHRGAIQSIAVIDNGFGMVPEMIRAACAVGASCPLGEGPHLARAGFGLPSAPFAIGQQFEVVSRPTGAQLASVVFDLEDLGSNDAHVPLATRAELPPFVTDFFRTEQRGWSSGTIVVIRNLDRLAPRSPVSLSDTLRERLGYVFGNFSDRVTLRVGGCGVPSIDPLFLDPASANVGDSGWHADDCGVLSVTVGDAAIAVRTSLLPSDFAVAKRSRKSPLASGDVGTFVRDTMGVIVTRLGRRLTVLPGTPWFNFSNADRAIRVEANFPPALDHLLAPSLSLQQVQVNDSVWAAMRTQGVAAHLDSLRRRLLQAGHRRMELGARTAGTSYRVSPAA